MVKIVNFVYAASLYGAIMFALYGNEALIGDSGEGHRRNITPSLAPSRGGGFDIRSGYSLSRASEDPSAYQTSLAGVGGELVYAGAPKTEAVTQSGGLGY